MTHAFPGILARMKIDESFPYVHLFFSALWQLERLLKHQVMSPHFSPFYSPLADVDGVGDELPHTTNDHA